MPVGERQEAQEASRAVTGWAGAGELANATDQALVAQVNLQPGAYTIQFSVSPIVLVQQKTFAEILWMVAGGLNRRVLSVYNGTSISGVGNGINIRVFDRSPVGGGAGTEKYQVNATVGRGTRPSQVGMQPILTGFDGTTQVVIPSLASATFNIPDSNAGINSIFLAVSEVDAVDPPIAQDEILVEFYSLPAGAGVLGMRLNYLGCNRFVPILPGMGSFTIRNRRAAGSVFLQTLWGIDG